MAKPCRNITETATNSHHEREAIPPSGKREGTRERARYHWKDLDPSFSDHLSDRQIDVRNKAVELQRQFRPVSVKYLTLLSIISGKRIAIPSYLLRVMLVFVRGVGAVYVCDQSGDEAN
ncbi:hypothetical protein YC2023_089226 [Brassica napus]